MDTMISAEEQLLKHVEKCEDLNPQHFYEGKRAAIKAAQDAGLTDEEIEISFNIKIRPDDKKSSV